MAAEIIAEVVRSGFVEGHHRGSLVALAPDGSIDYAAGDPHAPMLPRSCNKPLQALGMLRAGLDLDGEMLALACASHSGEPFHLEVVRRILAGAGLTEATLGNVPDYPLDEEAKEAVIRAGGHPAPILMNCSGKHAAMLATCVANGWPTEGYLDPAHPLQRALETTFAEMTAEPVAHTAVDGCGAPLLATSLVGLARAFSRLARGVDGHDQPHEPSARIAAAVRDHPTHVSGTRRDEAVLLRALPGAIGKAGAESCYVVALPDGRAFASKTDDGAARARPVTMAALLERQTVTAEEGVDADAVRRTGRSPLLGGGAQVGEIRAVLP